MVGIGASNLTYILLTFAVLSAGCARRQSDPALTKRINGWLDTFLTGTDGAKLGPMFEDAEAAYKQEGIPSIARVGDAAAYGFVFINSMGLQPESRTEFLNRLRASAARHEVPDDALVFAEAMLRKLEAEEKFQDRSPSQPALRDEILKLHAMDQSVRQKAGFDRAKMDAMDRSLTETLLAILKQHGVPTFEMVGVEPAKNFVVMLQHQPADLRQEELPRLKANIDAGQGDPSIYAMVYDTTQLDQGKKQLYGEKLECGPDGAWREAPMEDESNVNMRRAQLALMRVNLQTQLIRSHSPNTCGSKQ